MCVYVCSEGVVPEDGGFGWRLLGYVNYHNHRKREGLEGGSIETYIRTLYVYAYVRKYVDTKCVCVCVVCEVTTLMVASSSPPMVK